MSKFVTYPAVTVLDNDHSLLIDDPNAGTNSITAENAGNTLLSKWAGFETFDEAVQNTIEHNQEFIDRDTAIREETAELKKKIVTTFPSKEASGAVATFESEFEDAPLKSCIVRVEPVQDLHGQDSPYPAGGGKNKFQTTTETRTVNGTTFTVNDDGTVTVVGTPTANINGGYSFGEVTLPAGNYKLNGNSNPNSDLRLTCYNVTASSVIASIYNNNDLSFTLSDASVIRLYPFVSTSFSGSAITMKPMIRIASESDATFAPYENICPISGWTGAQLTKCGKNLLNPQKRNNLSANIQYYNDGTGFTLKANATYVFSVSATAAQLQIVQIGGTALIKNYGKTSLSYTPAKDVSVFFDAYYSSDFPAPSGGTRDVICQLELGSTATAYEPYTGQTYPITFPSEAGTVYGGYVDVINGELVVDRAIVDLGTPNWIQPTVSTFRSPKPSNAKVPYLAICSNYKFVGQRSAPSAYCIASGGSGAYVIVNDPRFTDATAFKAAMSGVQLVYELAEPIHYPLTPIEIKTLLGQNNIWADTGDTAVEYLMSDVSWYVEKKLRAFQSILAGVEDSSTASKNYSANTYLVFNDDIYKTTKAITAGETIEEGVNVTKTTVAEQLLALAQA